MKSYQIYYALIIFQLISMTLEGDPIDLKENEVFQLNLTENAPQTLKFSKISGKLFHITILSLDKDIQLNFTDVNPLPNGFTIPSATKFTELKFIENITEGNITFFSTAKVTVEITSVLSKSDKDISTDPYYYSKKEKDVDTEITMEFNNFIIILENQNDVDGFDMKFKFNENSPVVKNKATATYGFLFLPEQASYDYIALGKHYKNLSIGDLSEKQIDNAEMELKPKNGFYKKDGDNVKTKFAFIFSIDSNEMVGQYSFSINSEIINVFLIVSIVIALVFAVITFFLIRRKQSAESTNIEGSENLLKGDKEEGEGKEEKEGGEEKEDKGDKEDKVINEDNAEQEQKKIEAAEN